MAQALILTFLDLRKVNLLLLCKIVVVDSHSVYVDYPGHSGHFAPLCSPAENATAHVS